MSLKFSALTFCFLLYCAPLRAEDGRLVERRIWIGSAFPEIGEGLCADNIKKWRCLLPDRKKCIAEMRETYGPCSRNSIPELPEYIDGSSTKAKATKVIVDCISDTLVKKHIVNLSKEKMAEYNECTGAAPRSKPRSPYLQKAQDFSKTQIAHSCAEDGFLRKCYTITEQACKGRLDRAQLDCTMKMDANGTIVKNEVSHIQETGRKITDCALQEIRKSVAGLKKKTLDKECN